MECCDTVSLHGVGCNLAGTVVETSVFAMGRPSVRLRFFPCGPSIVVNCDITLVAVTVDNALEYFLGVINCRGNLFAISPTAVFSV